MTNKQVTTCMSIMIGCFLFMLIFSIYNNELYNKAEINENDTIRLQIKINNIIVNNKELKEYNDDKSYIIIKNGIEIIDLYKSYKKPLSNKDYLIIDNLYKTYYNSYDKYINEKNAKNRYDNIEKLIKDNKY